MFFFSYLFILNFIYKPLTIFLYNYKFHIFFSRFSYFAFFYVTLNDYAYSILSAFIFHVIFSISDFTQMSRPAAAKSYSSTSAVS